MHQIWLFHTFSKGSHVQWVSKCELKSREDQLILLYSYNVYFILKLVNILLYIPVGWAKGSC